MRIPLASYAVREILLFCAIWIVAGIAAFLFIHPAATVLPAALLIFTLSFFRDPHRDIPGDEKAVVAPADGKVVEIGELDEREHLNERCVKIGIFLSVFNVHINRAPCGGKIERVCYQKGKFVNALYAESAARNENNVVVIRNGNGGARMVVKQIAGAIARRIVCACKPDDILQRGQRFGMIKFGSRTELYVPVSVCSMSDVRVKIGDTVKGGETIVGVLK